MIRQATCTSLVFMLSLMGLGGCGKGGLTVYDVSGNVTFAGKPIPDGWIVFSPDSSKQNSGPQGMARIKDGKFDTDEEYGQGTIGGAMLVRIDGFDGVPGEQAPNGKPIMAPYNTTVELPKDDTTIELVVPPEIELPAIVP